MKTEKEIVDSISVQFRDVTTKVIRSKRASAEISAEQLEAVLSYCKEQLDFIHLSHISIVDWLEEGYFEIIYILWSYEDKINLFIKVKIPREKSELLTMKHLWPQVHTYEREMYEMYGVKFLGNEELKEFILEDWDAKPPMRRDFDTVEYVNETYFERSGREDKKNVRDFIADRTSEVIPEYAKKYSR